MASILNSHLLILSCIFVSADDLPTPDPALNDSDFEHLIRDLGKKKHTIVNVNRNEATCREFISSFMNAAVAHVKAEDKCLQLKIEEWLDGTRGYGPVDYSVDLDGAVVLVHEAKKEDFEKGAAQNIVQMHSAVEVKKNFFFDIHKCYRVLLTFKLAFSDATHKAQITS